MNSVSGPPRHTRWVLALAIAVPPLALAALLATVIATDTTQSGDLWVGAADYGPASDAPPDEVQTAHDALHDIGTRCRADQPDLSAIAVDVDLVIEFARRYPTGRFPIDDETATSSSLLLVTSEAVTDCAPGEVDRLRDASE